MRKSDFLHSKFFKILTIITGTSTNNCNFLKFIISVRGGHWDYLPWVPRNLATPLAANKSCAFYIFRKSHQSRLP
jgi:hypothetical protein